MSSWCNRGSGCVHLVARRQRGGEMKAQMMAPSFQESALLSEVTELTKEMHLNNIRTAFYSVVGIMAMACGPTMAAPVVISGTGTDAAALQSTVDAFRSALTGPINAPNTGPFRTGRREINWDAVPDSFSSPNLLPANFFNNNSRRGCVLSSTNSNRFLLSQRDTLAGFQPSFGEIDPSYATSFRTFSPQRLFIAEGLTDYDVTFAVPVNPAQSATISGFGVVFTDVDLPNTTGILCFDAQGSVIFQGYAPPANSGLSFLGVHFTACEKIARVRIVAGNAALGAGVTDNAERDVVAVDDFIYSEPQGPGCIADVDDGTGTGLPDGGVTIDDLLYYLDIYAGGSGCADLDDGTGSGIPDYGVTIDDLLFFLDHFASGC